MKLSVCIITKEESEQLKRCLASLKKYDMEIVVVDTGSVDKTKQVIDEYADKEDIISGMIILQRQEIIQLHLQVMIGF